MQRLTRDELVDLVRRLLIDDFPTEQESWEAVEILRANVPDPMVTDYIFWPDPIDQVVDPEQVVDRALRYRPTTGGGQGAEEHEEG